MPTNERFGGRRRLPGIPRSAALGNTVAGRAWALRALHPCNDLAAGCPGIPDLTQPQSALSEIRHSATITAPPTTEVNWDCQIAVLPFVDASCVVRTKPSESSSWSYWLPITGAFTGPARSGHTLPLVLAEDGSISQGSSLGAAPSLITSSTGFRQPFKGITTILNCNSISNQGMLTAGQWNTKPREYPTKPVVQAYFDPDWPNGKALGFEDMTILCIDDVPVNPDEIIIKCPNACQWEARKGFYLPMRFNDPTHPYNPGSGTPLSLAGVRDTTMSGYPFMIRNDDNPEGEHDLINDIVYNTTPTFNGSNVATADWLTTAGPINQNFGLIQYSNIDKTASIIFKLRSGLEYQPDGVSDAINFVSAAPLFDDVSLKCVQLAGTALPIGYEHKYNSEGAAFEAIAKAVAKIAPIVIPHLINWAKGAWDNRVQNTGPGAKAQKSLGIYDDIALD